jgi:hypothetical protein
MRKPWIMLVVLLSLWDGMVYLGDARAEVALGCGSDLKAEGIAEQEKGLKLWLRHKGNSIEAIDPDKAAEAFRKAISIEPRLVRSYVNLSAYYYAIRDQKRKRGGTKAGVDALSQ